MKNLAIIPARGGSKRIPRKNIKNFLGKPIIAYSIEAVINSGLFDEVMVSTDDEEIVDIAKQYGAQVPFLRSEKTANDYATLSDVIDEVVEEYSMREKEFDNVCLILATAPFIKSEGIIEAYNKLINNVCSMVYPIAEFSYPILRSLSRSEDGYVVMNHPEHLRTRSQDLPPAYYDTGTYYWHKLNCKEEEKDKKIGVVIDQCYVQDIDTESDWNYAELKYKLLFCEK